MWLLLAAVGGTLVASVLSLMPALHVYNVAGLLLLATTSLGWAGEGLSMAQLAFFFLGMVIGYATINMIPSIFFAAPDESTLFIVLPGQKYLLQRWGYEAAVLTGIGGLGGIAVLGLMTPIVSWLLPALRTILQSHLHWILWTVMAYMLLSEWPKGSDRAPAGWRSGGRRVIE